jgi:hypothetical protein
MKRLALTAAGAAFLAVAFGSVVSARGGATVDVFPVSFVLTSGTCSTLPAGTTLIGSGTETSVTTVTNQRGAITIENSSHAFGTATDQDGNVYVFNYSNDFRGTFDEGGVFSGHMNDAFSVAGSGSARVSNGFSGDIATDFATFFTVPYVTRAYGDPLDFASGAVHCDPL